MSRVPSFTVLLGNMHYSVPVHAHFKTYVMYTSGFNPPHNTVKYCAIREDRDVRTGLQSIDWLTLHRYTIITGLF